MDIRGSTDFGMGSWVRAEANSTVIRVGLTMINAPLTSVDGTGSGEYPVTPSEWRSLTANADEYYASLSNSHLP